MGPALLAAFCLLGGGCRQKEAPKTALTRDFVELSEAKSHLEHRAMTEYRRYCAFCHGDSGKGDGINAFNITPPPRNFTDPKQRKSKTAADLAKVIRLGGGVSGMGADMPPWGRTLTDEQIEGLTDLVLSFSSSEGT
jgi:mono/diheme cytochrome c family protein